MQDVLKEKWQQELQNIEQRRNDPLPEQQKIQKRSQQDKKEQCQTDLETWTGDSERVRNRSKKGMQKWKNCPKIQRAIRGWSGAGWGNQKLARWGWKARQQCVAVQRMLLRSSRFFGVEHRMKKEDMEEQFNQETKKGWRFATDAARLTDDNASSEDGKHTSRSFSTWTPHTSGRVCGSKKSAWSLKRQKKEFPTCRSKSPNGEFTERTCGYVLASRRFQGKIKNMDVVEDFRIKTT